MAITQFTASAYLASFVQSLNPGSKNMQVIASTAFGVMALVNLAVLGLLVNSLFRRMRAHR
jgi:hypothetical protein